MGRIAARGDGTAEHFAGFRVLFLVKVKLAKLFQIRDAGIIQNRCFDNLNARFASMTLECNADQTEIRHHLDNHVDKRAERTAKENDEEPKSFSATPKVMNQRQSLENKSPRIEKVAEHSHMLLRILRGRIETVKTIFAPGANAEHALP